MIRVLYLVGNLGAGGLERFVTRMSLRSKAGSDFESAVMCLHEKSGMFVEQLQAAGIDVLQAPAGWRRSRSKLKEMAEIIRNANVDLIHSQVNFSLWQQFSASKMAGIKRYCVTERNCYDLKGFERLRRAIQFHALRRQGALYSANGKAVAAHLARIVHVPASWIEVLPNGVQVPDHGPQVRVHLRQSMGWSDSDLVIGYVSRMASHKGHLAFLDSLAVAAARNRSGSIRACLVGDGPERSTIESRIRELGLGGVVKMTGTVPNVDEYMEAFDVVSLLSSREGMANVLLEAMAASKAIVASNVGANAELLDDGRCGVLIDNITSDAVGEQYLRMEECPELRLRLGASARARAEGEYGIEACYQKLVKHYSSALSQ